MSILVTYRRVRHLIMSFVLACLAIFLPQMVVAQIEDAAIDPNLHELVQIVKTRAEEPAIAISDPQFNLSLIHI